YHIIIFVYIRFEYFLLLFFFFSSRRRHTRSKRDWSSDVCSSDLRTVNTNPADGSYSLVHPAGTFSVLAESYGFHSDEQEVTIEDDEVTEASFVLDELDEGTLTGTITNEATGDAVEDATILLEEDASIEPVHSDEDGNYSLTAYEGDY